MKIAILGSTGMLGNAVSKHFCSVFKQSDIVLTYRNKTVAHGNNRILFDPLVHPISVIPDDSDFIINCIGVIKPVMSQDPRSARFINSVFPWDLSSYCLLHNIRLIHITTDCVYSGRTGNYNESSTHDCLDAYGKSKSLGEPDNCMVLRTSIIGEEIHKKISLIEWAKSQKGKTVSGFTNHLWNGITTQQYAIICQKIIEQNLYSKELYHVFSNHITKYDLLKLFNKRFDLDLNIEKKESEEIIDRTLSSLKDLNTKLMIPSIQDQISSM